MVGDGVGEEEEAVEPADGTYDGVGAPVDEGGRTIGLPTSPANDPWPVGGVPMGGPSGGLE